MRRRSTGGQTSVRESSARRRGTHDDNLVRRDEIKVRTDLLIEQIRIDMRRFEAGYLVQQRVALGFGRCQDFPGGAQLLGNLMPGLQAAVALDRVVDEIRG